MTAPTRRAALTALAGFPALAIPGVAATVAPSPDAEILALRAEFVRLNAMYMPLNDAAWEEADAFRARVEEDGWEAACAWADANGFDGRNEEHARLGWELSQLATRMLDVGPTSLAGIAAVAATLKEDLLVHYWAKPIKDRDYEVELVTKLIDALVVSGQRSSS